MTDEIKIATNSADQGNRATKRKPKVRSAAVLRATAKQPPRETKTAVALKALHRKRGASIVELREMTGWQAHSVRGFLSGALRKKLGLAVMSEVGKDGVRRYRIDGAAQSAQVVLDAQVG
jgi:hypothetical protein